MYLMHHGVKGQQWGVRNGPPYPIDKENHPVYIKAGTKFKRLSVYDESQSAGHAYVNYLKSDSRRYRGFFGARLKVMNKGKAVYSIELEAAKDLMAPSKQERVKTFVEMYKDDPVLRKKLGDYHKDDYHDFTPMPRKFYEQQYSNLAADKIETKGYETFVRAVGGPDSYIRDAYFKKLSEKGYHFVTDDMDAGVFGEAPSIIFDRQASTKYKGQTEISNKEIQETWRKEGTYINEEVKRSRQKPRDKTEQRKAQLRKNVSDVVEDVTSRGDKVGDVARQAQYNADFVVKTGRRLAKRQKW